MVGNLTETTGGRPHVVECGVPIRSGDAHTRIPLVPKSGSEMVDANPIERAIALEAAGHMPSLATDIFDQLCRSVPTVELDIDGPALGQEGAQGFQELAR